MTNLAIICSSICILMGNAVPYRLPSIPSLSARSLALSEIIFF